MIPKLQTAAFTVSAIMALMATACQSEKGSPALVLTTPKTETQKNGRALFLKNCAHCHGAEAFGDDGPNLHGLDLSNEQITNRILNGKKGEMTAFAGKLQPAEIDAVVAYVQTLK